MQPCTEQPSSNGGMDALKTFKLQQYHKTSWTQTSSSIICSEGVCGNTIQVRDYHEGFLRRATSLAPKGEVLITGGYDQWRCPNLPARRGVAQYVTLEHMLAVGTHYGLTWMHRAYTAASSEGRLSWHC